MNCGQMAPESARQKVGFYTHFAVYIVVNVFLIALWWFTGGLEVFPWFLFPLFGLGIGLLHTMSDPFMGRRMLKISPKESTRK